jgi:hypothetical protein
LFFIERVKRKEISQRGGATLLRMHYKGSIALALKAVYPEVEWQEWRFKGNLPKKYWKNKDNIRKYIEWLPKQVIELVVHSIECLYT